MAHSGVYVRYGKHQGIGSLKSSTDRVLTVSQVKDLLNCSRTQVYNMIDSGRLKAFRIGEKKGLRVHERDVEMIKAERVDIGI